MLVQNMVLSNAAKRGSLYGASLVASEFDDSDIVLWGPRGCTSQIIEAMNAQRQQFGIFHFALNEGDLLVHGVAALRQRLLPFIDKAWNNIGCLFLFLGDAPQLTGEDIETFLRTTVAPAFPMIYVETGLAGDHYYGVNETLYKIVERLCPRQESHSSKSRSVNLVAEVGLSPSWRGDALELRRLLVSLGFEVNVLVNRCTVREMREKVTCADATVLVNPRVGVKAASYLQEQCQIPFLSPTCMPIGLQGTRRWLEEVNSFLGGDTSALERLVERETDQFLIGTRPGLKEEIYTLRVSRMRTSKFVVCDEKWRARQWARLLLEELNFAGGYVYATAESSAQRESDAELPENVEWLNDAAILAHRCRDDAVSLVLGADWLNEIPHDGPKLSVVTINHPVMHRISLVSRAYLGFQGLRHFLEDALNQVAF